MTSEEIKQAMLNFTPVMYEGIEYERINAYIYRIVNSSGKYRTVMQVELKDKKANSVVIADAKKVSIAERKEK